MTEALVSIGMSVFNEAETLGVALRSMLNQTYNRWELIVVDDGSSDATAEIIASFDCCCKALLFGVPFLGAIVSKQVLQSALLCFSCCSNCDG